MGILGLFNKKKEAQNEMNQKEFEEDLFKSDPLMDPDSGLNLPKDMSGKEDDGFFDNKPQTQNRDLYQKYSDDFNQNNMSAQKNQQETDSKDMQIIIAKLDALRAEVQTLNHKIENLERKQQKKMW